MVPWKIKNRSKIIELILDLWIFCVYFFLKKKNYNIRNDTMFSINQKEEKSNHWQMVSFERHSQNCVQFGEFHNISKKEIMYEFQCSSAFIIFCVKKRFICQNSSFLNIFFNLTFFDLVLTLTYIQWWKKEWIWNALSVIINKWINK